MGGGGQQLPKRLRFEKFVCQNERIRTLRGALLPAAPPGSANGYVVTITGGRGPLERPLAAKRALM